MLLVHIEDVEPGMCVGASVFHPENPQIEILKPGADLTPAILKRLQKLGVTQMWVAHNLTRDLDHVVAPKLTQAKLEVYTKLRDSFADASSQSVSTSDLGVYRKTIMELVTELVANRQSAGMVDQLFAAAGGLFSHCANVAYLATMIGLELDTYVRQSRTSNAGQQQDHVVNLGLAGMLHDIGKVGLDTSLTEHHEIRPERSPAEETHYRTHPALGHEMLQSGDVPPTVRYTVRHHHQRYDGKGWPDLSETTDGRKAGKLEGERIHIYTRIVSAANVLDNLMRDGDGHQRPPVAALHDFASPTYDGWFDPVVRLAMLRRVPPFATGTKVELSDGRAAVVVAPNLRQPCRPTVRLLDTPEDDNAVMIALEMTADLHIRRCAGADVEQWLFTLPKKAPPSAESTAAAA